MRSSRVSWPTILQLDLLAAAIGQVADNPRESREKLVDGDHPQVERRIPNLPADTLQGLEGEDPRLDPGNSRRPIKLSDTTASSPAKTDQIVKLRGVDPDPGMHAGKYRG